VALSLGDDGQPGQLLYGHSTISGHYRFYELDPSHHITAGYSVECGSDAEALRAARTLKRATGVEVWKSNNRVAHLAPRPVSSGTSCGKIGWRPLPDGGD
jgi:hypothetical protein